MFILLAVNDYGTGMLCANVGDARVVLCRAVARCASPETSPFDDDEYERVVRLGGFVSLKDGGRVMDDLALTRALATFTRAHRRVPAFHAEELSLMSPFFIIGCDGVWDVLSDEQAVDLVAAWHGAAEGAAVLRDLAFVHGSTDNISAMVVDLSVMVQRL